MWFFVHLISIDTVLIFLFFPADFSPLFFTCIENIYYFTSFLLLLCKVYILYRLYGYCLHCTSWLHTVPKIFWTSTLSQLNSEYWQNIWRDFDGWSRCNGFLSGFRGTYTVASAPVFMRRFRLFLGQCIQHYRETP